MFFLHFISKINHQSHAPKMIMRHIYKCIENVDTIHPSLTTSMCSLAPTITVLTVPFVFLQAQKEEEQAATRAGSRIIYTNLIANIIKKLRDETGGTQSNKICPTVSKSCGLA